jgi:hypothetical protein
VVTFSLAAAADVRVRVLREGRWVASPLSGTFLPGSQRFVWDGTRIAGALRDGTYEVVVEARDHFGAISHGVPFTSDTVAPRVRFIPGGKLRVEISEPSMLTMRIDGEWVRCRAPRAGVLRIPWSGPAARVRIVAWDEAGNASGPVVRTSRASASEPGQ